jgi:hypothetical protein
LGLGYAPAAAQPPAPLVASAAFSAYDAGHGGSLYGSAYADASSTFGPGSSFLFASTMGGTSSELLPASAAAAAAASGLPPTTVSVRVTAPEVSAALLYAAQPPPAGGGCAAERLTVGCAGLVLCVDSGPKGHRVSVKLFRLEANEHLTGGEAGAAAAARVPGFLPAGAPGLRPAPGGGGPGDDGLAVWPLLCCGGSAMESGGLPNVGKPSLRLEVGARGRFSALRSAQGGAWRSSSPSVA